MSQGNGGEAIFRNDVDRRRFLECSNKTKGQVLSKKGLPCGPVVGQGGGVMRTARMRIPEDRAAGYYHCISRVVDRWFLF